MSIMRRSVIDVWSMRDDPERVNRRVASIVMLLDVIHVHRATHSGDLENVFRVVEQIWILPYEFLVAFEVDRINLHQRFNITDSSAYCVFLFLGLKAETRINYLVKSYKGDKQSDICFSQSVTTDVPMFSKNLLASI